MQEVQGQQTKDGSSGYIVDMVGRLLHMYRNGNIYVSYPKDQDLLCDIRKGYKVTTISQAWHGGSILATVI